MDSGLSNIGSTYPTFTEEAKLRGQTTTYSHLFRQAATHVEKRAVLLSFVASLPKGEKENVPGMFGTLWGRVWRQPPTPVSTDMEMKKRDPVKMVWIEEVLLEEKEDPKGLMEKVNSFLADSGGSESERLWQFLGRVEDLSMCELLVRWVRADMPLGTELKAIAGERAKEVLEVASRVIREDHPLQGQMRGVDPHRMALVEKEMEGVISTIATIEELAPDAAEAVKGMGISKDDPRYNVRLGYEVLRKNKNPEMDGAVIHWMKRGAEVSELDTRGGRNDPFLRAVAEVVSPTHQKHDEICSIMCRYVKDGLPKDAIPDVEAVMTEKFKRDPLFVYRMVTYGPSLRALLKETNKFSDKTVYQGLVSFQKDVETLGKCIGEKVDGTLPLDWPALVFKSNSPSPELLTRLGPLLTGLKELHFDNSNIGSGSANAWGDALGMFPHLTTISIENDKIDPATASVLGGLESLVSLKLSSCGLDEKGLQALFATPEKLKKLKALSLEGNPIGQGQALRELKKGLVELGGLTELGIARIGLDGDGFVSLSYALLRLPALTKIDIAGNEIREVGKRDPVKLYWIERALTDDPKGLMERVDSLLPGGVQGSESERLWQFLGPVEDFSMWELLVRWVRVDMPLSRPLVEIAGDRSEEVLQVASTVIREDHPLQGQMRGVDPYRMVGVESESNSVTKESIATINELAPDVSERVAKMGITEDDPRYKTRIVYEFLRKSGERWMDQDLLTWVKNGAGMSSPDLGYIGPWKNYAFIRAATEVVSPTHPKHDELCREMFRSVTDGFPKDEIPDVEAVMTAKFKSDPMFIYQKASMGSSELRALLKESYKFSDKTVYQGILAFQNDLDTLSRCIGEKRESLLPLFLRRSLEFNSTKTPPPDLLVRLGPLLTGLRELKFVSSNMGSGWGEALSKFPSLTSLSIEKDKIDPATASVLGGLESLEHLTLTSCDLDDEALQALFATPEKLKKLKGLSLDGNPKLGQGAALRELQNGLVELEELTDLGVANIDMDADGFFSLSHALLRLPNLRRINLAGNEIGEKGKETLEQINAMRELGLLTGQDVKALIPLQAIQNLHYHPAQPYGGPRPLTNLALLVHRLNGVNSLQFTKCGLGSSAEEWKQALKQLPSLRELTVQDDKIYVQTVEALAQSLPSSLTSLRLIGSRMGDEGAIALAKELGRLRNLETLDLSGVNLIGERGKAAIAIAVPNLKVSY